MTLSSGSTIGTYQILELLGAGNFRLSTRAFFGVRAAYVEPVGVGDVLPDMPLFLTNDLHIMTPLEPTYQAAWDASPEELRLAIETGVLPAPEDE